MARRPGTQASLVFLAAFLVYNTNLLYIASFDSLASSLLPFRILSGHGLRQQEMETFADRGVAPLEAAIQVVRGTGGRP